ncbi:MAG: hypothetical protein ACC652_04145 [Acidimicrobiales bacterium]
MDGNDCRHRATLGVTDDVTQAELRRAYHARLLRAHPDHGGSREQLQQVLGAFAVLRENAQPDSPMPAQATQPGPPRPRPSASFSVVAARKYAQQAAPTFAAHTVAQSGSSQPTEGTFADVLQRAVHRIERFQVEVLQPDYSS